MDLNGHRLRLIQNDCHVSTEGRLTFHLSLYCSKCDEENVVRGKLRQKYQDYNRNAAIVKLLVFREFRADCDRKVYNPSSQI
jgi:hypothetical protein